MTHLQTVVGRVLAVVDRDGGAFVTLMTPGGERVEIEIESIVDRVGLEAFVDTNHVIWATVAAQAGAVPVLDSWELAE